MQVSDERLEYLIKQKQENLKLKNIFGEDTRHHISMNLAIYQELQQSRARLKELEPLARRMAAWIMGHTISNYFRVFGDVGDKQIKQLAAEYEQKEK